MILQIFTLKFVWYAPFTYDKKKTSFNIKYL